MVPVFLRRQNFSLIFISTLQAKKELQNHVLKSNKKIRIKKINQHFNLNFYTLYLRNLDRNLDKQASRKKKTWLKKIKTFNIVCNPVLFLVGLANQKLKFGVLGFGVRLVLTQLFTKL
jgi:hypothetical protein